MTDRFEEYLDVLDRVAIVEEAAVSFMAAYEDSIISSLEVSFEPMRAYMIARIYEQISYQDAATNPTSLETIHSAAVTLKCYIEDFLTEILMDPSDPLGINENPMSAVLRWKNPNSFFFCKYVSSKYTEEVVASMSYDDLVDVAKDFLLEQLRDLEEMPEDDDFPF